MTENYIYWYAITEESAREDFVYWIDWYGNLMIDFDGNYLIFHYSVLAT